MLKRKNLPSPLILESQSLARNYEAPLRRELNTEVFQHALDIVWGYMYSGVYFTNLVIFKTINCKRKTVVRKEISSNRKAYLSDIGRVMLRLISMSLDNADVKEWESLKQELLLIEEKQYQGDNSAWDNLNSLRRPKKTKVKLAHK